MPTQKRFYITTAISYPNGPPHIGHAYEAIATDAIARFKRLDGYDTYFLTGTDEHGLKMEQAARKNGISPREMADRLAPLFQEMVKKLNCSNDDFIRTVEQRHHKACQDLWRKMEAAGDIYMDSYAGWYSVRDEAFYDESELTAGEGGEKLSPQGTPVEWMEEESYFFRLSKYQDRLLAHYEVENPDFIRPAGRRNEIISFVKSGLRDLCVSRTSIDWGIPVPGAPGHVMYVWVDALTNYMTGVGYPDMANEKFQKYWPEAIHIIGKDIVRFHSVYWPAFLMSAGISLPKQVFGHGFLFNKGEKMSKSVGNVIDPSQMADHYGVDQMRYFFLREVPFGQDGSYSHEAIVARINADLANDFGNLAQRTLSMIAKNCDGRVPVCGDLLDQDKALLKAAEDALEKARKHMEQFDLHLMLEAIWTVVGGANTYIAREEPWALKKTDPPRMATVLYVAAETIRRLAILAQPVIPTAAAHMLNQLAAPVDERGFTHAGHDFRLKAGIQLPKPEAVFPRYVETDAS